MARRLVASGGRGGEPDHRREPPQGPLYRALARPDRRASLTPAVAILPYPLRRFGRLADVTLDALHWPLGRPERLTRGTVADLEPGDHLLTYPKTPLYFRPWGPVRARVSMMIVEPDAIHRKHLRLARLFHRRFHRVLTKSGPLLAAIPNGRRFIAGGSMIEHPNATDTGKTRMVSLIASGKRDLEGHRLRHRVADHVRSAGLDVEIMGRGYQPFARKEDGLAPYRYSIVIENRREAGYLSEKLIDAMICRTVPIYWGAPDIARHVDPGGLIPCDGFDGIVAALERVSDEDYAARQPAIEANRLRALALADTEARAARLLVEDA